VDEVMDSHRARMPGAAAAGATDPNYQYHWRLMRTILALADIVMEDEDVPVDVRRRVVRGVVYGGPNVADAEHRVATAQQMAKWAQTAPARLPLPDHLMRGWPATTEVPDPFGP
jgi:hypothetical protein